MRTYVHGTAAVVLNNLVARLICTTANNPGFLASLVSFLWILLVGHSLLSFWRNEGKVLTIVIASSHTSSNPIEN